MLQSIKISFIVNLSAHCLSICGSDSNNDSSILRPSRNNFAVLFFAGKKGVMKERSIDVSQVLTDAQSSAFKLLPVHK